MSLLSRLCSVARVDEKNKSDDYPEMVGTVTLILGKALGSLEEVAFGAFGAGGGTTLGCFGAFSMGAGEDVQGRFEDCPVGTVAKFGVLAGSCACLDLLSLRGGESTSSSSLESSLSSSSSASECHSPLSPPLAPSSTSSTCT